MPHGIDDQFGHGQTDGLSSLRHDSQRHHIDTQNPVIAIDAEGVSECVIQAAQVVAQIDFREQTGSLPSGMERGMDLSHGGDTCARNRESLANLLRLRLACLAIEQRNHGLETVFDTMIGFPRQNFRLRMGDRGVDADDPIQYRCRAFQALDSFAKALFQCARKINPAAGMIA